MRVLIDYRAALRERSGVGEYAHQLVRAMLAEFPSNGTRQPLDVSVFSSSWKDRLRLPSDLAGAHAVDRRVPVSLLNFAWHRLEWPPAESLAGRRFDVTHSLHPLMMPARDAARVVTIHDLNFLAHPERTRAEVRRDYAALAGKHARRADAVIVISEFTAGEVKRQLGIDERCITVCTPGAPQWPPIAGRPRDGYVLFLGTLEPRKNVGGLLDAYERVVGRVPPLVLAGKALQSSRAILERIGRPPLAGHVRHIGYVDPANRQQVYAGARLLVQPSFDEGFGMPVLEAMTVGVPVVAANRGALPEVLGDAGVLVDPQDVVAFAEAIERTATDDAFAERNAALGIVRARRFSWERSARLAYEAYQGAIARKCGSG